MSRTGDASAMSTQLVYWRGGNDQEPQDVYDTALDGEHVDGVEAVDRDTVLAACKRELRGWTQDDNIWTYHPDADGNGPGFDLELGDQVVCFTCYGLDGEQMNQIIHIMRGLGYPLYDPQIDERFL